MRRILVHQFGGPDVLRLEEGPAPHTPGSDAALFAGLENRTLRPIVGREFPLAEAAPAHEAVTARGLTARSF